MGNKRYEQAVELLPLRLRRLAMELPEAYQERAEELRLRVNQPLTVVTDEGEYPVASVSAKVTAEDMERIVESVTEYSRYASVETLRRGFLIVRGAFRLGVCGTVVLREGESCNIKDFSSLALRIVREHPGVGEALAPRLFDTFGQFQSALLLSPPGGGKTTLLRDLIRCLSNGDEKHPALRVAVIDERGELAMSYQGEAQTNLGSHTDVLDGCPKSVGIPMVLRAMAPQVIAVDEIASTEDVSAMCEAANCGVGLLATIHANSMEDLYRKPLWRQMMCAKVFSQAVQITSYAGKRTYHLKTIECPSAPKALPSAQREGEREPVWPDGSERF